MHIYEPNDEDRIVFGSKDAYSQGLSIVEKLIMSLGIHVPIGA
jgi:pantothenate synthetase